MKTLILIATALSLSGCFTMRIENAEGKSGRRADEWHHDIVFGLAEITPPVDLSKRCPDGWNWVETKETFIQGFIQAVTWNIYNPKNVEYSCAPRKN